ncbi:MAG: hypothetical protein ACE5RH_02690 [Nitrosarchaeum sp.]
MPDKVKVTETQLLLFDMVLGSAIRALMGEYRKIINANEQELEEMKKSIDERFESAIDKIKNH